MSPSLEDAHSRWLAQLAEMRAAIAELDLSRPAPDIRRSSPDLVFDEKVPFATAREDDIWDLDSEWSGDGYSSEDINGTTRPAMNGVPDGPATAQHNLKWLNGTAAELAARNPSLDPHRSQEQLLSFLASDHEDEELQTLLVDLLGYDELDLVAELLAHRQEVVQSAKPEVANVVENLQTREEREQSLRRLDWEHKHAALAPATIRDGVQYPHVYKRHDAGNTLSVHGRKYALPNGSVHDDNEIYEEYSVPATQVGGLGNNEKLVAVKDMDGLCRKTFAGYKTLNRMQSLVYPVAYETNENMLICAPTGAGKTDAAMLTILSIIRKNVSPDPTADAEATQFAVRTDDFKIVYVAPMKALAAEITEKLGKRLSWLGIQARELTGDMHLTKTEIVQTQIIVTTPEKWDVVTRKSTGDTELVQKVRLLIIDEVHMLHDERGAVLESLVARTQRQVESTQSLIRIVGLSATLPNFIDVADFLKVNRMAGLFYFDGSFRPVPLEQHFVGAKGRAGSKQSRENLEQVTFLKVKEMLGLGHQVMLFVHSRKDTVRTARALYESAIDHQCANLLDPTGHPAYERAIRDMKTSKSREIRDLLPKGMGTHHAGMPRSDRNLMERLFAEGVLKVLCCTATLAWGVNLPAAAVIIKGTQLYSAQEGKFVDLGILDVLQMFGRAGRPQYEDQGIGFICTTHDKLHYYLSTVTQQHPIESRFSRKLVDNLNAEIALGTVTSVAEAVQWLGYTYLFVRMQRNPLVYGIDWAEKRDDPQLVQRRRKLIIEACRTLQQSQMIIFNVNTEELRAKDVGRIASQFYVLQSSIEIFNELMRERATEADVLRMISMSAEFDNIQSRESEEKELSRLVGEAVPCQIGEENGSPQAKTNILLQSFISRARVEDFTLVSDTAYVAQNAARICRALFMIAINRRWGYQSLVLLSLCKSIERQVWPYEHPFHQFELPQPILRNLDEKGSVASVESLRDMQPDEIGDLVHNKKMGGTLFRLLENFPTLDTEAEIAPLNRHVLRVRLYLTAKFAWNDRHHGTSEPYWVWVENSETSEIYHYESFILTRKKLRDRHELHFTIPLSDPLPPQIYVRAVSDRWLGAETVTPVSFQHLVRPDTESVYTDLLNLQPLPISALKNSLLEEIYGQRFQFFNPMQTQVFHCMYHTPANVLLGSPTGSGKTIAAELAMWWAVREKPGSKVVYIAPMKALVRERVHDWRQRLAVPLGMKLVELTGDNTPDTRSIKDADIIITTPEKWDGISRSWQTRDYVQRVSLVIIDEIHLLGGDRGPVLEIIVSRMNYIASQVRGSVRLVGMSTACANATDLAHWLGVREGLFNFRHSVRPVPLEIFIDGFPEQRGFCPLMQSMNRPTFLAIKSHSPDKPVIVFVASRRQTRLTAKDLINFCGMEDNPRAFVRMSEDDLMSNLSRVKDDALRQALSFGIGLHHAGLVESDRQLSEELFTHNKIQILVATSTLAWGINMPAHLVVVKGTQYYDAKVGGYKDMDLTDVLQMLGRAGRPQFDSFGIARIFTQDSKKAYYKHFLHTGFPVESSLHKVLDDHFGAEIAAGTISTKQDALDYLTWTFFFRRLHKNPSYYGLELSAEESDTSASQLSANEYVIGLVNRSLTEIESSGCISIRPDGDLEATPFGRIMSYYYLSHKTIRYLLRSAKRKAEFEDVITWVCCAAEFDELPVRHNEDLINTELSRNLPIKGDILGLPMGDPHVKALLLLEAHFSMTQLPISDYVGDQISVLDQSLRVIQASIDVLAELGFYSSCKMMITLLQCVKSSRWPTDNPLTILPGISVAPERDGHGDTTTRPWTLLELGGLGRGELRAKAGELDILAPSLEPFLNVAGALPTLRIRVINVNAFGFKVNIERSNPPHNRDMRMYAPRFPKPQSEGFFVIAYDPLADEIFALKRVGWSAIGQDHSQWTSRVNVNATLQVSERDEARVVDVEVVSDGYLGMEWGIQQVEIPPVPAVSGGAVKS